MSYIATSNVVGTMMLVVAFATITLCTGCFTSSIGAVTPQSEYARITGEPCPRSATVVSFSKSASPRGDLIETGPGSADGETQIVLKVDPEEMNRLLRRKPPFDGQWQKGVLPDIVLRRASGLESLAGHEVIFSLRERCCSASDPAFELWNGDVIVIKPETNEVIVVSWDM